MSHTNESLDTNKSKRLSYGSLFNRAPTQDEEEPAPKKSKATSVATLESRAENVTLVEADNALLGCGLDADGEMSFRLIEDEEDVKNWAGYQPMASECMNRYFRMSQNMFSSISEHAAGVYISTEGKLDPSVPDRCS